LFCLSACTTPEQFKEYSGYNMTAAFLDEEPLAVSSIYPNGASLRLYEDGTGRIQLGDMSCAISWTREGDRTTILINGIEATGHEKDGVMLLDMGDTGLRYEFSAGEIENNSSENNPETELQKLWNGKWNGRLYFHNTSGEWLEYETRSMAADADVQIDSEGFGKVYVFNSAYSDELPMMSFDVDLTATRPHSLEGFLMGYVLKEGDVTVSLSDENPDDIENTVVIHPEEFNWYVPELGLFEEEEEPEPVKVLRLSGTCLDSSGGL
jgi:hypothetical protein